MGEKLLQWTEINSKFGLYKVKYSQKNKYMKNIKLEETLKEEFRLKKITLTKVARDCQIPPSVLHGWLHGTLPSAKNINHIKTLADYLGYSVDHLLFGKKSGNSIKKTIVSKTTFTENGIDYHLTIERY